MRSNICVLILSCTCGCNIISGIGDYETNKELVVTETTSETSFDSVLPDLVQESTSLDTSFETGDSDSDSGTLEAEADSSEADACIKHWGALTSYTFCAPFGLPGDESTYSIAMAEAARTAGMDSKVMTSPVTKNTLPCGTGSSLTLTSTSAGACAVWVYSGSLAGYFNSVTTTTCRCPGSGVPGTMTWN